MVRIDDESLTSDLYTWPLVAGRIAAEIALITSVSFAKIVQLGARSADTALAKYIELAEQEMKVTSHKETIRVD